MFLRQISVFIQNKSGTLAQLTAFLGKNNVDLKAISLADTSDFGIVRLIVGQENVYPVADLLKAEGYAIHVNHVICVCVPDRPSGLAEILGMLAENGITVEYLYSFMRDSGSDEHLILRLSDRMAADKLFNERGVKTLDPAEVK